MILNFSDFAITDCQDYVWYVYKLGSLYSLLTSLTWYGSTCVPAYYKCSDKILLMLKGQDCSVSRQTVQSKNDQRVTIEPLNCPQSIQAYKVKTPII